jgi:hypothetical protein
MVNKFCWSRGAATAESFRFRVSSFEFGYLRGSCFAMLSLATVRFLAISANSKLETRNSKLSVARFAGSADLKGTVSQGSQSLALGLSTTAASQLDEFVRSRALAFGKTYAVKDGWGYTQDIDYETKATEPPPFSKDRKCRFDWFGFSANLRIRDVCADRLGIIASSRSAKSQLAL